MKRKFLSLLLATVMFFTIAMPVFASAPLVANCPESPEGIILIDVNTIDELLDAINRYTYSEYYVVIILGPDICPEEADLIFSGERSLTLLVFKGALLVARMGTTGIMTVYYASSIIIEFTRQQWNAGVRGSVQFQFPPWHHPCCAWC